MHYAVLFAVSTLYRCAYRDTKQTSSDIPHIAPNSCLVYWPQVCMTEHCTWCSAFFWHRCSSTEAGMNVAYWNQVKKYCMLRKDIQCLWFVHRYLLYYWPITSAIFGISFNMMFISLIMMVAYYNLQTSDSSTDTVRTLADDSLEDDGVYLYLVS